MVMTLAINDWWYWCALWEHWYICHWRPLDSLPLWQLTLSQAKGGTVGNAGYTESWHNMLCSYLECLQALNIHRTLTNILSLVICRQMCVRSLDDLCSWSPRLISYYRDGDLPSTEEVRTQIQNRTCTNHLAAFGIAACTVAGGIVSTVTEEAS